MRKIRIGSGAGYSGDRIEPAVELAAQGDIDYLVFECLAERTIALAQQARKSDPLMGYDPLLIPRMKAVLPTCASKHIRIITNMGAANPLAAAKAVRTLADSMGLDHIKVAAVVGDDVLETVVKNDLPIDIGGTVNDLTGTIVSANAYIGAQPIAEALRQGADVVITGRAADPSLFLGALVHEFSWTDRDWSLLGKGILAGHLLECAGQITGGYFADPGFKDVAGLDRLGFPIGEVREDGDLVITKVAGSGGEVTTATVKEQILYEIHDPASYYQPDVIADFSNVRVTQLGPDRVHVEGAQGRPRSGDLKVSIGYRDGFIGEGQISYAGAGCVQRGQLALNIVKKRLAVAGGNLSELRFDLIGLNAMHGDRLSEAGHPYEVRVRVAGRSNSGADALNIGNEVETLYTNGPAGGGGAWKGVREVVAITSAFIPEAAVQCEVRNFNN